MSGRSRNWTFTLYDIEKVEPKDCKYWIYGVEKCPTTGKRHLQGGVQFEHPIGMKTVQERIGHKCHVEACKKEFLATERYCKKDGEWYEGGERPLGQGHRSDLDELCAQVKAGASVREIAMEKSATWVRNYRGIEKLVDMYRAPRNWLMEVISVWGPSGSGKTRWALENSGESVFFKENNKWWDGYWGQETVIWDDFDPGCISFKQLLRLLDRYPLTVENKGGSVQFTSKRIIFTSITKWDQWVWKIVPGDEYNMDQLKRRIHKTKLMEPEYEYNIMSPAAI